MDFPYLISETTQLQVRHILLVKEVSSRRGIDSTSIVLLFKKNLKNN